jgi:hypothetical protein
MKIESIKQIHPQITNEQYVKNIVESRLGNVPLSKLNEAMDKDINKGNIIDIVV